MVLNPRVLRGTFQNRELFMELFKQKAATSKSSQRINDFAHAIGEKPDVISRLLNGDWRSRNEGYELMPSQEVAVKLEDFLGQPRGTFGGIDVNVSFPPGLPLEEFCDAFHLPKVEPNHPVSNVHVVQNVTGADLEEPAKDMVNAGWRLIPLDKLGEWGRALLGLLHPLFKEKAIANQIPVLVEHAVNFDSIVITVPVPHGVKKSVVLPAAPLKALIESCPIISGRDAIFMITDMYMSFTAQRMEEVKSKTLGTAAMQDQLASLRQHVGDLDAIIGSMGPLGVSLRDVEHDVSQALGRDHPAATDLLALLDNYDTLRQEFRSLLRLIQGHVTK